VGRTCILDGSIEQKNKIAEIHTCEKNRWVNRWEEPMGQSVGRTDGSIGGKNRWVNRWEEPMGQQREQREEPMDQQTEQMEESMPLLYSPAISTEGRR